MSAVLQTEFSDLKLLGRGKVRDIYDIDDKLLIVSTDRISAFDVILPNGVDSKGQILTELSEFWFNLTKDIVPNHLITTNVDEMPEICHKYKTTLQGRSMLVKKATPFAVECVVRGYITGSGLKDYNKTGKICGIELPTGLKEADKLPEPIFTPSTKAEIGLHDESITFEKMIEIVGKEKAEILKDIIQKPRFRNHPDISHVPQNISSFIEKVACTSFGNVIIPIIISKLKITDIINLNRV